MKKWFDRVAVRHFASVLVSVVLSAGLVKTGIVTAEQAQSIGNAAGQIVGGA